VTTVDEVGGAKVKVAAQKWIRHDWRGMIEMGF
jgi:hypothetical protein